MVNVSNSRGRFCYYCIYDAPALSSDGLVQKDYEFVRLDTGWYYFNCIWVTDNEDIDYCIMNFEDIKGFIES